MSHESIDLNKSKLSKYLLKIRAIAELEDIVALTETKALLDEAFDEFVPQKINAKSKLLVNDQHQTRLSTSNNLKYLSGVWQGYSRLFNQQSPMQTMILHIEEIKGEIILGKIHWPDNQNTITELRGRFVYEINDLVENNRWNFVRGVSDTFSIQKIVFIESKHIQGKQTETEGVYYATITENNLMSGVWFFDNNYQQPDSEIFLRKAELN